MKAAILMVAAVVVVAGCAKDTTRYGRRNLAWAELQRRFLRETTRREYDYCVVLNGVDPEVREKFDPAEVIADVPEVREHHDFLHQVIAHCRTAGHSYFLILDSDAFPVCEGWDDALISMMQRWDRQIAAPVRFENHDSFPHPCAFFCTRAGIRDPRIDFVPQDYSNMLGRVVRDTGSAMHALPVLPLIRTNARNPHPLFGAIYQHLFYHHGAGSRGVGTRLLRSGMLEHAMTDAEHRRAAAQLFEELDRDPESFVAELMGRERLPVFADDAPQDLWSSPELYPIAIDPDRETATFRRLNREAYRAASFLDHRTPRPTSEPDRVLRLDQLGDGEVRPIRWILHTAFVGSTLLSRCLDVPGRTLVYREPSLLTDIADARRRSLVKLAAGLMSRTFGGEIPIVKGHDRINALAADLMALHPETRVLLIHADLETFLLATLKSAHRRRFLRRTWGLIDRSDLALPAIAAGELADHELAVALWLAIVARSRKVLALGARSLDCRRLFEDPRRTVLSAADYFGLGLSRAELEAVMDGGALSTYAKGSRPYDSGVRADEMEAHRARLAKEIEAAYAFLEEMAPGTPHAPEMINALV